MDSRETKKAAKMEGENTKKLTLIIYYRDKGGAEDFQGSDAIVWARLRANALFQTGGSVTVIFDTKVIAQEIEDEITLWTAIAFAALGEEMEEI
jgi:hypothetical protein